MIDLPSGPDCWVNQRIIFCGHAGYFIGDVYLYPLGATVVAKSSPVTPGKLIRKDLRDAQWQIEEMPRCYWGPQRGVFGLCRSAITKLK